MRVGVRHLCRGAHENAAVSRLRRFARHIKIVVGWHFQIGREAVEPIFRPAHQRYRLDPLPAARQKSPAVLHVVLQRHPPLAEVAATLCRVRFLQSLANICGHDGREDSGHRKDGKHLQQAESSDKVHGVVLHLETKRRESPAATRSSAAAEGSGTAVTLSSGQFAEIP